MRVPTRWTRVLAAAVLLAACSTESTEEADAPPAEVRIGLLTPLTGPRAGAGIDYRRGAELAAGIINAAEPDLPLAAGLPGRGSAHVVLTVGDSAGTPLEAAAKAGHLMTDIGSLAVVIADSEETVGEVSRCAERTHVPLLDAATVSGRLPDAGLDWYFRTPPGDRLLGEALLGALTAGGRAPRLAIARPADDLGGASAALQDLADEAGTPIVATAGYQGSGGPGAAATVLTRAKPDVAVVLAGTTADAVAMVRAVRARAPGMLVAGIGPGFGGAGFLAAAGASAAGVVRAETWSSEFAERNDLARRVAARYAQRNHTPMTSAAANGFTAVLTIAGAIHATAASTPAAVRAALVSADVPGTALPMPWSGVHFARGGQNTAARGVIEQVRDGRARIVYPAELAGAELQP